MRSPANLALIALVHVSCAQDSTRQTSIVDAQDTRTPLTESIGDIRLEQTDSAFITYPSGLDVSKDGEILIADASQGNVKWYDKSGRLKHVIGRKGSGPGEFMLPYFPRFASSGGVYVIDIGRGTLLSRYDAEASYMDRIALNDVRAVGHVELVNDSVMLMAGRSADIGDKSVLFEVALSGEITRRWLSVRDVTPTGAVNADYWRSQGTASFALKGDTAFVVVSTSDTLWTVHLPSGSTRATRLTTTELAASVARTRDVRSLAAMRAMFGEVFLTATPVVTDSLLIIPFIKGVYLDGGRTISIARRGSGGWISSAADPLLQRSVAGLLFSPVGSIDSLAISTRQTVTK